MASSDKEEQQLLEAGNKLLNPPTSVDQLLPLLDQLENCLSKVEQSPSASMLSALSPSQNALVADQLLRHPDIDVKVAVASCISEITRITAPDAPYEDNQMKDVFQLIVSSFENLADKSSRSYGKRTSILETVAKVRSCVVMLDLECDALITEMFQNFLNAIRDYHPENVFSSMVTIMTLVLEESEDVSSQLLSPLLASAKRGNEEVLPAARKLGEKVLESCAVKVKPYLHQAVKSLEISLDDYSDVVRSICQETPGSVVQNDHAADENKVRDIKPEAASSNETAQAEIEVAREAGSSKQTDPAIDNLPKSIVSNGVTEVGENDSLLESYSLKKHDDGDNSASQLKGHDDAPSNAETDILEAEKPVNEEIVPEQATMESGRKDNSSTKSPEPSDNSQIGAEQDAQKLLDAKSPNKDVCSSPIQEASTDAAVSSEGKKEAESSKPSTPKAQEGEVNSVASPSGSASFLEESLPKKAKRSKRKESLVKDSEPSADDVSRKESDRANHSETVPNEKSLPKKANRSKKKEHIVKDSEPSADEVPRKESERTNDSETVPDEQSARKASVTISSEDKAEKESDTTKNIRSPADESVGKPVKKPSKKAESKGNNDDGSFLSQNEVKIQRSRGKSVPEKNVTKNLTKDDDKGKVSSPKSAGKSATKSAKGHKLQETPKTEGKRKLALGSEKASETKDYDADLIGARVKVFWPEDREFYKGVVSSYDPKRKKHEIAYDDGDVEILLLKDERWERIDSESDEDEAADRQDLDGPPERHPKKKAKSNIDKSSKQGKVDASPSRGGGSSSKSKSAAMKSRQKSKEVGKADKSSDGSKANRKADDDNSNRSESKSSGVSPKTSSKPKKDDANISKAGKSKEDGSKTPKTSKTKEETAKTGKSKQDTPKVTPSTKGKSPKSSGGGKSSANGTGKLKSDSSKVKESEENESSADLGEPQESTKRKSLSSSKRQGSEGKSGKKRRRL